jgi:nuclease S1
MTARPGHYRDFFWKQQGGQVVDLPDAKPDPGELLDQLPLQKSAAVTTDPAQAGARAVAVAWLLHLAGDIHQPLHCSARVTAHQPKGDGGGNLFKLERFPNSNERNNLHKVWDAGVDIAVPRKTNESTSAHLERAAAIAVTAHPKASMVDRLKPGQFREWCRESVAAAQVAAYPPPPTLKQLERPRGSYFVRVGTVSLERVALGGYRLASLLEEIYGQ